MLFATRFPAPLAVGDGDCIGVHHRRLDARPGAHVDANLFAQKTAKDEGGQGQDCDSDVGDWMGGEFQ